MTTFLALWQQLQQHYLDTADIQMRQQFADDPKRFDKMHETLHGLLFDYSKNRVSEETLDLLCRLAEQAELKKKMLAMRNGEKVNASEERAALHTALRLPESAYIKVNGENVVPRIHTELRRAFAFADCIISGEHAGITGKRITDFVHIGIGGSDLGPQVCTQSLQAFRKNVRVHFIGNSDDAEIAGVLAELNPETTVFSIASKSFDTPETLLNAQAARDWYLRAGLPENGIANHFCAISGNVAAALEFGIPAERVFAMFNWVGGRYSVWSAIGLPVMVAVGSRGFRELLDGAHAMDEHFFNTDFRRNIPVLMGLLNVWYNNFCGSDGHTVVPYSHAMRRFPSWLNQLDMESCGKSRKINGMPSEIRTGGIVFGEEGVNCQHAYFQLLHQGMRLIPCDFIVPMTSPYQIGRQHKFTVANAIAQAEALMKGKTEVEARAELAHLPEAERDALAPHKTFPGNRPSNSFLLNEINPFNLGMLLAAYEHRTFVQSTIWHINPFDQWGVEYGKVLAKAIELELASETKTKHDSSTNGLIAFYRNCQK